MHCVLKYSDDVLVVEGSAHLMTGLQIYYLTDAAYECATRTEDVSALIPTDEDQIIGLRNAEGLCVQLLDRKREV